MSKLPNIIIFNPDQWRSDVMGHLGNAAAITPNLDRIVEEDAVSFSNAFCQNTVCTPSRCSFMTGWYPHTRGHRTMHYMLRQDEPCLLKHLKDNGYFVWWGGKNDLVPGQNGFENYCDVKFHPTDEDFKRWDLTPRQGNHSGLDWRGERDGDSFYSFYRGCWDKEEEPCYCDGDWAMVLGAIDFIRSHDDDKPFCIFLPLGYPHPPYVVEEPWYSAIDRDKIPARFQAPENWQGKPSILKGIAEGQGLEGWDEDRWRELRATYYGMCARVDHQFGLLMDALKDNDCYDDSAVFLFSDHGDYTGDYGLVEKTQNTFEDCLSNVPLIVKPPKSIPVKAGVRDALVELVDFPATVEAMTEITLPWSHFGQSLLPVISGNEATHKDAVFCEGGRLKGERQAMERESLAGLPDPGANLYYPRIKLQTSDEGNWHSKAIMVRDQDYKYIRRLYEEDEFYDLKNDPGEEKNRINDPDCQAEILRLKERLLTHYQQTCDVVPVDPDKR